MRALLVLVLLPLAGFGISAMFFATVVRAWRRVLASWTAAASALVYIAVGLVMLWVGISLLPPLAAPTAPFVRECVRWHPGLSWGVIFFAAALAFIGRWLLWAASASGGRGNRAFALGYLLVASLLLLGSIWELGNGTSIACFMS